MVDLDMGVIGVAASFVVVLSHDGKALIHHHRRRRPYLFPCQ
jgi:hypothetical protein